MMDVLDIIVIAMGFYVIWAAVQLKTNGTISSQVMKSPNRDVKNVQDLPGFQKFVFPRCLVMGLLVVFLGAFSLATDAFAWFQNHGAASGVMETVAVIAVIVYMFWYAHEIHVAEKKFY